jgi:hypothetical protein
MQVITSRVFRNETVYLDDKLFVRCAFEGCLLVYSGKHCEWELTSFSNCRITLQQEASNTLQVLQSLGVQFEQKTEDVRFS